MTGAPLRRKSAWRAGAVILVFAFALFGAVGIAHAILPPIMPPPIVPPFLPPWMMPVSTVSQPATITGEVRSVIGAPIGGVTVEVHGDTSSTANPYFSQTAVTKGDGTFVITDIIQGTYQMTVNEQTGAHPVLTFAEAYPWADEYTGPTSTLHHVIGGTTVNAGVVTLAANGVVTGRAMDGATPVSGSLITAEISQGGFSYRRWATTGADGTFSITNARPGDYTLTYTASGSHVPVDAFPGGSSENGSVASGSDSFSVSAGAHVSRPDYGFQAGGHVLGATVEAYGVNSYNISGIWVTLTEVGGSGAVYNWSTDDDGWARVYVPPGTYDLVYHDDLGMYEDKGMGTITVVGGGSNNVTTNLAPSSDTYAIHGRVTQSGSSSPAVYSWVTASKKDPTMPDGEYFRRVSSTGPGTVGDNYMVRVPVDTGYAGNRMTLDFADRDEPSIHVTQTWTTGTSPVGPILHDVSMPVGGTISGTVHDEVGDPVEGVLVAALHRALDPYSGEYSWGGTDTSWTRTDADGDYSITGLPANSDYKVTFSPYYDPGMPLPIKYADYYRRTWQGRPLADSLNTSGTPVTVDHDPVNVTLGATHSGVDETVTPGGYVGLHANGPAEPTGAVWCDVFYRVGDSWIEVDSGYTTGGTFEKLWKVLPTGNYTLNYSDFFGRGAGSWAFTLIPGETKYTSVLVPAPMTLMSGSAKVGGAFAGLIDGGLEYGGTGGANLNVQPLISLPATLPPPPSTLLNKAGVFDFASGGPAVSGVWTLTIPYDPAIPDSVVGNIRVWHATPPTGELLTPIAWDTVNHTVQVQTLSLSPFQVGYTKQKVSLGTPSTSGVLKAYRTIAVYGSLKPRHTASSHGAYVKAYIYNSRHKWVYYKTFTAKVYNYSSYSRYRASVRLKRGSYRFYGYTSSDTWHLATTSSYRSVKIR